MTLCLAIDARDGAHDLGSRLVISTKENNFTGPSGLRTVVPTRKEAEVIYDLLDAYGPDCKGAEGGVQPRLKFITGGQFDYRSSFEGHGGNVCRMGKERRRSRLLIRMAHA